jgi:hypothetical protein
MLRIVPTRIFHAPNPVTGLSDQEPLALRVFALDLSNCFVGDMSSCKQGAVSALCRGHSATTRNDRATTEHHHVNGILRVVYMQIGHLTGMHIGFTLESVVEVLVRQLFN